MTTHLSDTSGLQALAVSAVNKYAYDKPDPSVLERFPNPALKSSTRQVLALHIEVPEFTSLCPLTGQPDFATIVIDYVPNEWCVESKALKLYMMSFRNHGEFHEACVVRICDDIAKLLSPDELRVEGRFTPRGGIPFWPTAVYSAPYAGDDQDPSEFTGNPGDVSG